MFTGLLLLALSFIYTFMGFSYGTWEFPGLHDKVLSHWSKAHNLEASWSLVAGSSVSGAHTYYTAPSQPHDDFSLDHLLSNNKGAVGQANPQKTATAVPTPQNISFGHFLDGFIVDF